MHASLLPCLIGCTTLPVHLGSHLTSNDETITPTASCEWGGHKHAAAQPQPQERQQGGPDKQTVAQRRVINITLTLLQTKKRVTTSHPSRHAVFTLSQISQESKPGPVKSKKKQSIAMKVYPLRLSRHRCRRSCSCCCC